jgi:hypothetical protein
MSKFFASVVFCLAAAISSVSPAATLSVGTHVLQPNTPDQQILIFGDGGESIVGLQLGIQVAPINNVAPQITGLQIVGPETLLGSLTNGQFISTIPGNPWFMAADALRQETAGAVTLQSTLPIAILTVDTTGIDAGPVAKSFFVNPNPNQNPTSYLITDPVSPNLIPIFSPGTLIIEAVPEPSTFALAGLAGVALVIVGGRRARKS